MQVRSETLNNRAVNTSHECAMTTVTVLSLPVYKSVQSGYKIVSETESYIQMFNEKVVSLVSVSRELRSIIVRKQKKISGFISCRNTSTGSYEHVTYFNL